MSLGDNVVSRGVRSVRVGQVVEWLLPPIVSGDSFHELTRGDVVVAPLESQLGKTIAQPPIQNQIL